MKSVTNHNILNNIPILCISHKGLEAIKQIVKIAPEEAQWFHTIEPVVYKNSPNEVHLHLSEKIYIPTQNTSAAQVDTTSSMMIEFYRELSKEHQDQQTVNQILSSMTCWCHSHHNMSPNPSAQDDSQFNSFITLAEDQDTNTWQVMLIFNKKDQFYSRVYDPTTHTIHEGVPIHVVNDYDFSYINEAAKTKFKKSPKKLLGFKNFNNSLFSKNHFSFETQAEVPSIIDWDVNIDIAESIVATLYSSYKKNISTAKASINSLKLNSFLELFSQTLSIKEYLWLFYVLSENYNQIIKTYDIFERGPDSFNQILSTTEIEHVDNFFVNYFSTTKDSLNSFTNSLALVLYFDDAPTKKDLVNLVKGEMKS
jgi:hypothetical protein